MRIVPRALLGTALLMLLVGTPAQAAETLVYDVTTSSFTYFPQGPHLSSTTGRVLITDHGPQTDGSPRWTTESGVLIFDQPGRDSPNTIVFGNPCAVFNIGPTPTLSRVVEVNTMPGDFAWWSGFLPTGEIDPYAFFCLKLGHQSTTTWSEQVSIGTRVFQPKAFITQPKGGATVSGTVWVVLWAEGTTGASNVFTLSTDGKQVGSLTTSSGGPVTIPWVTKPVGATPVPNGTHTLTGTVRDATGITGTTSITVNLKN